MFVLRIFWFAIASFLFCIESVFSQSKNLDYFLLQGMTNNPVLKGSALAVKLIAVQNEMIAAQNRKARWWLSGDYLLAPYFNDNGKAVSITDAPSKDAYGYEAGITNGGLYSALVNVSLPLFNMAAFNSLYDQNKVLLDLNDANRLQAEHDMVKDITDRYVAAYQLQQQQTYTVAVLKSLEERKPVVGALVEKNLLQQTDYKLLDLEISQRQTELQQLRINFTSALMLLRNSSGISDTASYSLDEPQLSTMPSQSEYHYLNKFRLDSLNLVAQQNIFNTRYRPQLNVFGNTGLNGALAENIPHNFGIGAGLGLSIPLYDGHQRNLMKQQTDLQMQILQSYKTNTAVVVQNNIQIALRQISEGREIIQTLKNQISQREVYLDMLKEKVISGQKPMIEYILAIQDYVSTQQAKTRAESDLLLLINQYNYYNW